MKFIATFILSHALLFAASPIPFNPQIRTVVGGGGGGGSPAAFSDDFGRTAGGDLGANWLEAINQAEIFSDSYRLVTGGFAVVTTIHNTSTGTTTQYIKISFSGIDVQYPWIVFRYTDSVSGYYAIQFDGANGAFDWYYFSDDADTTGDGIDSGTFGQDLVGDTVGFTIEGTGGSIVVRAWHTPTNLPSTASNWDGDITPNDTLNIGAGTALDTGTKVGIGGQTGSANTVRIDNFFGGGL